MVAEAGEKEIYKAIEVCRAADVAPYVLRYWQTEFPFLATSKDKGPNRTFTRREVKIISRIRELLYDEGFTIAGAKKRVEAEIAAGDFDGATRVVAAPKAPPREPKVVAVKRSAPEIDRKAVVKELKEVLKILDNKR
jgi:DNA-binding transcriptional MerR regulator